MRQRARRTLPAPHELPAEGGSERRTAEIDVRDRAVRLQVIAQISPHEADISPVKSIAQAQDCLPSEVGAARLGRPPENGLWADRGGATVRRRKLARVPRWGRPSPRVPGRTAPPGAHCRRVRRPRSKSPCRPACSGQSLPARKACRRSARARRPGPGPHDFRSRAAASLRAGRTERWRSPQPTRAGLRRG